ncbi:MAG: iron ABC transporter permease [Bacteroidaceae bacterium]|nr:iron ABC transporter permease [Bacteroidaceae bacterium]
MRQSIIIVFLIVAMLLLAMANLLWGSLSIPVADVMRILLGGQVAEHPQWTYIILESRVPQMLTALLCGMSLSTCGLMLQTLFRNPLAGPSILGIDAGANLGVALVMLSLSGTITLGSLSVSGYLLVIVAAMLGALCIMLLLLLLSSLLRNQVMLLITGVVISYVTGSVISLLNYSATEEGVHNYIVWGMGNFSGVSMDRLPLFCILILMGLLGALLLVKPLDAILLGERYATNLGVNVHRTRNWLLLCTGLLTATTTAFCGPISFLGLAVPHIARLTLRTSRHRVMLPGSMLMGACLTLLCNLLCTMPASGSIIPVNVITPLIGAPVILYVILKRR